MARRKSIVQPRWYALLHDEHVQLIAQTIPSTLFQDTLYRAVQAHLQGCPAVVATIYGPDGSVRILTLATRTLRRVETAS